MILKDFELFCNPVRYKDISKFRFIDHNCLDYCDYVVYLACPTINGELDGYFEIVSLAYLQKELVFSDYCLLAVNYLDNIVLEID